MSDDCYRCSFDGVADAYERARPGYAPDAVAWLAGRLPFRRVLDLAAGTGKLTRQLLPFAEEVVAVEPGDHMRRVLAERVAGVEALSGTAEDVPLPDGSVDAVTVAQAFHWFEPERALAEMHRVLRPGGGYALLWNEWEILELDRLVERLRKTHDGRHHEIVGSTPLFTAPEKRVFAHADVVTADVVVERVASISAVIAAPPEERERTLAAVRELVGAGEFEFRMQTTVLVADRVSAA